MGRCKGTGVGQGSLNTCSPFTEHSHGMSHEPGLCGQWMGSQRKVALGRACLGWMGEAWAGHRGMSFLDELDPEERGKKAPYQGDQLAGRWPLGGTRGQPAGEAGSWSCGFQRPGLL